MTEYAPAPAPDSLEALIPWVTEEFGKVAGAIAGLSAEQSARQWNFQLQDRVGTTSVGFGTVIQTPQLLARLVDVRYEVEGLPDNHTFAPVSGNPLFSGSISVGSQGPNTTPSGQGTVVVYAVDEGGNRIASQSFNWVIVDTAGAAEVSWGSQAVAAQSWLMGTAIEVVEVPPAVSERQIIYTAAGFPSGVRFDASSRLLFGAPRNVGSGTGTITATVAGGGTATLAVSWTVEAVPAVPSLDGITFMGPLRIRRWVGPAGRNHQSRLELSARPTELGVEPTTHTIEGLPSPVVMLGGPLVSAIVVQYPAPTPPDLGTGFGRLVLTDSNGKTAVLTFPWEVYER